MKIQPTGPDDLQKGYNAGVVILTGIATAVHPALGVAVGLAGAYFGPAMERRHDRVKELVLYVQQYIDDFNPQILEDEMFQDGFVLLMEKYIRERNEQKRLILQRVLRGYIQAPSLLDYPLEEMADLVSRLRLKDVETFRKALQQAAEAGRSQSLSTYEGAKPFLLREDPYSVSRLVYFGLLYEDRTRNGVEIREHKDQYYLHVWLSPAGREFARYLDRDSGTQ